MADEGDGWTFSWDTCTDSSLDALLRTLPRAQWALPDPATGETLLHRACRGDFVAATAALLQSGLDVNARTSTGFCPVHLAALARWPRTLQMLCAAGADLRARDACGRTPLDCVLAVLPWSVTDRGVNNVRVLVANGMRLSTTGEQYRHFITPELEAFERGVLRCRAAVVVLLGLKRRRGDVMWALDRWVVRELCFDLWSTRIDVAWQSL